MTATLVTPGSELQNLASELQRIDEAHEDYISDTRRMGFAVLGGPRGEDEPARMPVLNLDGVEDEYRVNDHAQNQMAARLSLPRAFWDRMRDQHPDILQDTVTKLMNREPEVRRIRTLDGNVRAYVSNRYRPLDNYDLATKAILPALASAGDEQMTVLQARLTDLRMYLKILFPQITWTAPDGKELHGGIVIGNSEVGAGSLFVEPFMYRSFCLNGMVFGKESFADFGLRKMHVGRAIEDNDAAQAMFTDETRRKDDEAFFAKAYDVVAGAISGVRFDAIRAAVEKAAGVDVSTEDVPGTVERVAKQNGLREKEQERMLQHLIEGGDLTAWGYVNALTRAAQDVESYDRQIELERLGGELLAVPNTIARLAKA